eukprot:SAG31_NODE_30978_length_374_cov_0.560000_1_plen_57_part_10
MGMQEGLLLVAWVGAAASVAACTKQARVDALASCLCTRGWCVVVLVTCETLCVEHAE